MYQHNSNLHEYMNGGIQIRIKKADRTVMTITNHLYAISGIRFTMMTPIQAPIAMAGKTKISTSKTLHRERRSARWIYC